MSTLNGLSRTVGAFGLALAAYTMGSGTADAQQRLQLECEVDGPNDISMHADYEERRARRKFSTEFEAVPGGQFREGQRMVVFVDGVNVGSVRLRQIRGGDVVGDLNFDTTAGPGDDDRPFPRNFPDVQRNTRVSVNIGRQGEVLACRLR